MTKNEFVSCLRYLVDLNLPGYKKFSTTKQEIWYKALQDLTVEQFKRSLIQIVKESKFFPTVAEIREHAGITKAALKEDKKDLAELAWGDVILSLNPYSLPKFSDKTIMKVINARGGWEKLCSMTYEQLDFEARNFKTLYVLYSEEKRESAKIDYADNKIRQLIDKSDKK